MNVPALLRRSAERMPDKAALLVASDPGPSCSFGRLDAEADRVARWLLAQGVTAGDRVAIAMHNCIHFAFAYFGILRAGAVAVPLNVMLTEGEIETLLSDCGSVSLLGAGAFGQVGATAARRCGIDAIGDASAWDELGPPDGRPVDPTVDEGDLAMLAYTSGTTGQPKGAMLTHGNLLANLEQQMAIPEAHVTQDDVLLLALPLFHIYGLNVTLGLLVMNGATGVILERFDPLATLQLIQDAKVSVLFGAPPMYVAWTSAPDADGFDLSSVRLAVSGAAPLPPEILLGFKDRFGIDIYEGYGLTETAPTISSNRMAEEPRPGSVGKPLPQVELELIGEDGRPVELGDPGEVVVRGPNVFQGYWNQPDETNKVLVDGWFHTGDVAVKDEDGYIYLVDRKRDLIIVSGFNVFPTEVEQALIQHDRVHEAAVIGIPHDYSGEAVKAYVVLEPGAQLDATDLLADLRGRLARFKCPETIEFVEQLPHLLSGKVLRRALRT